MSLHLRKLSSAAAILSCFLCSARLRAQQTPESSTAPAATAQAATAAGTTAIAGKSYEVDVPATTIWLDTKIDLLGGAQLQFTATGTATYPSTDSKGQAKDQSFEPDGLARSWRDLIHQYAVPNPVESRNHLRAWKSPFEVDGRPVWCAATHDIGFERDQRNNGLTHKIDPAIDGEREYVNDTLSSTGLVVERTHVTPPNALTTAKTATGGEFHSDGRILVLVLKNTATTTN